MISSIFDQALTLLPLLIGAYITISLLKLPDFSLESAYLFGAVVGYLLRDMPLPVMLTGASLGGALVGAIVSTLNQCFKLPYLLAAIITNGLFHGLTHYFLGTSIQSFHSGEMLFEPFLFTLIIVVGFVLRSEMGYSLSIYGNNPHFFEHHPVSGRYTIYFGVMLGHGCAGIGGLLFALSNGFVDLTMSFGLILLCLTALILGKSLIRTRHPNILIPVLGLFVYLGVQQTILKLGFNLKYFNAFQAIFVLVFLIFTYRKQKVSLDHLGV